MNANTLAKHYSLLTPEERFRLVLVASERNDEAEKERLVRYGKQITRTMSDHSPYAYAFYELAILTFIELLTEAADYLDTFIKIDDDSDGSGDEQEQAEEDEADGDETDGDVPEGDEVEDEADEMADAESAEDDDSEPSLWQRSFDLTMAAGFVFRVKVEGWKLFCERMSVPPFLLWKNLPGFERLQRALTLSERVAYVPEGFVRWLNRYRLKGTAKVTEVSLTAERVAAATEKGYREDVKWHGG